MVPVEAVARGYLTGSGYLDYKATGEVCGISLPPGLVDGDRLPAPIFTPASKAAIGEHDENVTFADVAAQVGQGTADEIARLTLLIFDRASIAGGGQGTPAGRHQVRVRPRPAHGRLVLGDEVLTPDSSRFWPADEWTPGRPQTELRQAVRPQLAALAGLGLGPPQR